MTISAGKAIQDTSNMVLNFGKISKISNPETVMMLGKMDEFVYLGVPYF